MAKRKRVHHAELREQDLPQDDRPAKRKRPGHSISEDQKRSNRPAATLAQHRAKSHKHRACPESKVSVVQQTGPDKPAVSSKRSRRRARRRQNKNIESAVQRAGTTVLAARPLKLWAESTSIDISTLPTPLPAENGLEIHAESALSPHSASRNSRAPALIRLQLESSNSHPLHLGMRNKARIEGQITHPSHGSEEAVEADDGSPESEHGSRPATAVRLQDCSSTREAREHVKSKPMRSSHSSVRSSLPLLPAARSVHGAATRTASAPKASNVPSFTQGGNLRDRFKRFSKYIAGKGDNDSSTDGGESSSDSESDDESIGGTRQAQTEQRKAVQLDAGRSHSLSARIDFRNQNDEIPQTDNAPAIDDMKYSLKKPQSAKASSDVQMDDEVAAVRLDYRTYAVDEVDHATDVVAPCVREDPDFTILSDDALDDNVGIASDIEPGADGTALPSQSDMDPDFGDGKSQDLAGTAQDNDKLEVESLDPSNFEEMDSHGSRDTDPPEIYSVDPPAEEDLNQSRPPSDFSRRTEPKYSGIKYTAEYTEELLATQFEPISDSELPRFSSQNSQLVSWRAEPASDSELPRFSSQNSKPMSSAAKPQSPPMQANVGIKRVPHFLDHGIGGVRVDPHLNPGFVQVNEQSSPVPSVDESVYDAVDEIAEAVFSSTRPLPFCKPGQPHVEEGFLTSLSTSDHDMRTPVRRCRTLRGALNPRATSLCSSSLSELSRTPSPPYEFPIAKDSYLGNLDARNAIIPSIDTKATPGKRKMTGRTSKHFTPDKRTTRKKAQPKLPEDLYVASDVAANDALGDVELEQEHYVGKTRRASKKKSETKPKRRSTGKKSEHFLPLHLLDRVDLPTSIKHGRVPAGTSVAPIPPITSDRFGIIQEKLWDQPFWLLIAVTFLNKTAGRAAVPTFWALKERYPTPQDLANADQTELHDMIHHLGLQTQRSKRLILISQTWIDSPPVAGRLYRTLHYPVQNDGKAYKKRQVIEEDVEHCVGVLEIGHMPGCGPYAWDSWRIFCRDVLRGVAEDYNGNGAKDAEFVPEWQRILPLDKELRATLRWMWLREGWIWDHSNGEKRRATEEEMERALRGEMDVPDTVEKKFAEQAVSGECKWDDVEGVPAIVESSNIAPLDKVDETLARRGSETTS